MLQFSELLSNSSSAFILKLFGMGAGYLFTFSVARILGAKAVGVFNICLVVITVGSIIGRLGFDTALLRFTAEYIKREW